MKQLKKAVIPAAGIGTRLRPATKAQPKEMLPVGRKPTIQYIVEEICAAGIQQVLIITSDQKRTIEDHFDPDIGDKNSVTASEPITPNVELFYTRQSNPTGLADAVGKAAHFVGDEPFIVCLGDALIQSQSPGSVLKHMIQTFTSKQASATLLFETVNPNAVNRYGIARPKGEGDAVFELQDLIEKPGIEEAPSHLAVAARYVFSPEIFDYIRQTPPCSGNEIQLTDSIRLMLQAGHRVWGVQLGVGEKRYDIGNFCNYFEALFDFALVDEEFGQVFREYAKQALRD